MSAEIEVSDEMVEAYVTAYANAYRRRIVDNVLPSERNKAAVREGLAAALATSGWTPPTRRCAALAAAPVINGEVAGDCDPHTCTKSADHVGPWHTCRCGVMFTLNADATPTA